jgi:hypothetical protein
MAGFFGCKTAGEVHPRIRTPQREHFVNANLGEEQLQDMMFWNDLYDDGVPEKRAMGLYNTQGTLVICSRCL